MKSNLKRIKQLSKAANILPQQRVPENPNLTALTKSILESPDRDRILAWLAKQH